MITGRRLKRGEALLNGIIGMGWLFGSVIRIDRSDLSISIEDGWLPVASILAGILHIQLEISVTSGDLRDFQLFGDTKFFSENWGGKKLQSQLGILLQKLRASKERDSKFQTPKNHHIQKKKLNWSLKNGTKRWKF